MYNYSILKPSANDSVPKTKYSNDQASNERCFPCLRYCRIIMIAGAVLVAIMTALMAVTRISPSIVKSIDSIDCHYAGALSSGSPCVDNCSLILVESIPENLTYPAGSPSHLSTYSGLMRLLSLAESKIEISALYWTLRKDDIHPNDQSADEGQKLFDGLLAAGKERHITIRIAMNKPKKTPDVDTTILTQQAGAKVRVVDFDRLLGAGVLHTKFWLIDRKHFYIGSANLDWRSFTQVKEIGVLVQNCSCLAQDMGKLFDAYWYLGTAKTVPKKWPANYTTSINMTNPARITFNGTKAPTYLSSSPPSFCADGRTVDIDAIVNVIRNARSFIYVAVMDYFPAIIYTYPNKFWPIIDDELRKAAFQRKVVIRILASSWNHTRRSMPKFLQSLADVTATGLGTIEAKLFVVPAYTPMQHKIPFTRVNHNKYMVTEQDAYIGTSNWSGDYFINTGGVGFIVTQPKNDTNSSSNIRQQTEDIFNRDWFSQYAKPLKRFLHPELKFLHNTS